MSLATVPQTGAELGIIAAGAQARGWGASLHPVAGRRNRLFELNRGRCVGRVVDVIGRWPR